MARRRYRRPGSARGHLILAAVAGAVLYFTVLDPAALQRGPQIFGGSGGGGGGGFKLPAEGLANPVGDLSDTIQKKLGE